ncbi:ribonuclease III [Leptolyngbya sp. DQ-M1]|uniref:ribonuclease III n=1 Tax=Leptolyngbya sp. DQ-M1 TaxID=2933920 RepID=UPI003298FB4D
MEISNKERIGKALECLHKGLYPWVEQKMQAMYGTDWMRQASEHLKNHQKGEQSIEKVIREDVVALLKIINGEWEKKTFKSTLNLRDRALVEELIGVRHQWAHQSTFSIDDTYRAVDTVFRLLKSISSPQLEEIEKRRQEVLRILSQDQVRHEGQGITVSPAENARIRQRLDKLLQRLPFQNAALLNQALTHTSYKFENPNTGEDNEQLEFLGDALLTFLSGDFLYKRHPQLKEGRMTHLRSKLVDASQLAKFAVELSLGEWMRLGNGVENDGGRGKPSLLSNVFEAVVGAYYLDSGVEAVRDFVNSLFERVIDDAYPTEEAIQSANLDAKSRLQQIVLDPSFLNNPNRKPPRYETIRYGGTDNDPEYLSIVHVADGEYGRGKGRSKKEAEKRAAENALDQLEF